MGKLLLEGREGVARSPERVEDVTGVSGRTVRRLEDGLTARPRAVTLDTLANFYGLDPDVIRQLAAWGDMEGNELATRIRDLAIERFGDAALAIGEDVDDHVLWMAMRLGRAPRRGAATAWGGGRTSGLVALATEGGKEQAELEDVLSDLVRLDRRRMQMVRELVRELRMGQDRERGDPPVAT